MRRGWDMEEGSCRSQRNRENYCIVRDYAPYLSQRGGPNSPFVREREHSPRLCNNSPTNKWIRTNNEKHQPRFEQNYSPKQFGVVLRETLQVYHISLFFCVNFKNLTIEFHVPYVLNMHIKFHSNRMLFTIRSINLFFIHNFRFQKL